MMQPPQQQQYRLVCSGPMPVFIHPVPVEERIVQKPIIREKIVPRYVIKYQPSSDSTGATSTLPARRPIIIIKEQVGQAQRERPPPPPPPPRPPPQMYHPPPPCNCNCKESRKRSKPRPARSRARAVSADWLEPISQLSDHALQQAFMLTSSALAAPDSYRPPRQRRDVIEVDTPSGVSGGDVITVQVPAEAGGGTMNVRVPNGVRPGETFEVPL